MNAPAERVWTASVRSQPRKMSLLACISGSPEGRQAPDHHPPYGKKHPLRQRSTRTAGTTHGRRAGGRPALLTYTQDQVLQRLRSPGRGPGWVPRFSAHAGNPVQKRVAHQEMILIEVDVDLRRSANSPQEVKQKSQLINPDQR